MRRRAAAARVWASAVMSATSKRLLRQRLAEWLPSCRSSRAKLGQAGAFPDGAHMLAPDAGGAATTPRS
jgi:hypothetical protein